MTSFANFEKDMELINRHTQLHDEIWASFDLMERRHNSQGPWWKVWNWPRTSVYLWRNMRETLRVKAKIAEAEEIREKLGVI